MSNHTFFIERTLYISDLSFMVIRHPKIHKYAEFVYYILFTYAMNIHIVCI